VTQAEWLPIASAIDALPADTTRGVRQRIRDSQTLSRPVVCPLLDTDSGTCLVYDARPVACRTYGFYAEREFVLGCDRIESVSRQSPDVIWGNHVTLEARIEELGPAAELFIWMAGDPYSSARR
jgi:Fe-S-cluster containining protein